MPFEFDPKKSQRNKIERAMDFVEAQRLWYNVYVTAPAKAKAGEAREKVIGTIDGKFWTAIITMRGEDAIRIISVRRAWPKEVAIYEEKTR